MLYSVADGDYNKWSKPQFERFLIGFVIMLMMGFISIDFWRACSPFIYIIGIILLLSVFLFGDYGGGAKRWLAFGSFRFQPSEIMKVGLVMFLSIYYDWLKPINTSKLFWVIIPILIEFCLSMFTVVISIKHERFFLYRLDATLTFLDC